MDPAQFERLNLTRSEMLVVKEMLALTLSEIAKLHPDPAAKLSALEEREKMLSYAAVTQREDVSAEGAMSLQEKQQFRSAIFASARNLLLF